MPDISMCSGKTDATECPRRERCYRFTATPTPRRQAYLRPPLDADGTCAMYWDNAARKEQP